MNEWCSVRREERAIYTHSKIQPFRSGSEVPTQIAETSALCKTLFKAQSKVVNIVGAGTSGRTPELLAVGISDSHRNSQPKAKLGG